MLLHRELDYSEALAESTPDIGVAEGEREWQQELKLMLERI